MRNKDNFINAFDYIKNQLFPYDYNNPEHEHVLKLKIWSLDSKLLNEETEVGIADDSFIDPKDHKALLDNEINLLDLYRRTEDGLLSRNEVPFDKAIKQRKKNLENWVKYKDPVTKETRPDYKMPYMSRPSTMTDEQFKELYLLYKEKEKSGQLNNCKEITSKITTDNIDIEKWAQESAILKYSPPAESKEVLDSQAAKLKKSKDDDIVNEMDKVFSKIKASLVAAAPELYIPPEEEPVIEVTETETIITTVEYKDCVTLAINCPTNREYIALVKDDPSHKGFIQDWENIHEGGYRFRGKLADITTVYDLPTVYEGFPDNWIVEISPYKIGEVEWTWDDFTFADKYTKVTTVTTIPNPPTETTMILSESDSSDSENGKTVTVTEEIFITFPHNPVGTPTSDNDLISFDEYKKIWYNFNQLRENKIEQTGLRIQIESLIDNYPDDILDGLKNYFEVLKQEKVDTEELLVERCLFGEWIY